MPVLLVLLSMPEILQLNWVLVEEPTDDVTNSSGTRIWYQAMTRDLSGATLAGVPQRNALSLAKATSMEDFQQKHSQ